MYNLLKTFVAPDRDIIFKRLMDWLTFRPFGVLVPLSSNGVGDKTNSFWLNTRLRKLFLGWVGMEAPLGSVHKEFVDDKLISRQLKFDCMHQQDCLARGKNWIYTRQRRRLMCKSSIFPFVLRKTCPRALLIYCSKSHQVSSVHTAGTKCRFLSPKNISMCF